MLTVDVRLLLLQGCLEGGAYRDPQGVLVGWVCRGEDHKRVPLPPAGFGAAAGGSARSTAAGAAQVGVGPLMMIRVLMIIWLSVAAVLCIAAAECR